MFNINGCEFYYNISGKVYSDNNGNCVDDISEESNSNLKMNLFEFGSLIQQTYTSQSGLFSIEISQGTYTYAPDTANVPFLISCPPSGFHTSVLTAVDSVDTNMDFGVECKTSIDLGTLAINRISGHFFPGDTATINVVAGDIAQQYNLNCAAGTSGTVTIYFSGPVQFAGNAPGSLVPTVTLNSLIYAIADFGALDLYNSFVCYFATDTTAQAGDQLCLTVETVPLSGDLNPVNNMYTHCFTVVNSFDPNIKEVNPIGFVTPEGWLNYTIHFQNTGSAAAQNIIVTDTLDADVQEGSFTYLGSSHNAFVNVTGNVVKFTFPNIYLPDSTTNEPGSHGYVQYRVKSDAGLALGTTIENTANIYFDFNPPVITNTTVNTVVMPTGLSSASPLNFELYPNPAEDEIQIKSSHLKGGHLNIYDISGRLLLKIEMESDEELIPVRSLCQGVYIAELSSVNSKPFQIKFIKK
jgi:uncharacterized repeat protein (TIGR01451 family)